MAHRKTRKEKRYRRKTIRRKRGGGGPTWKRFEREFNPFGKIKGFFDKYDCAITNKEAEVRDHDGTLLLEVKKEGENSITFHKAESNLFKSKKQEREIDKFIRHMEQASSEGYD